MTLAKAKINVLFFCTNNFDSIMGEKMTVLFCRACESCGQKKGRNMGKGCDPVSGSKNTVERRMHLL